MKTKDIDDANRDYSDDPSPEQIRQLCRNLQRTWTAAEERSHRTGSSKRQPLEIEPVPTPKNDRGQEMG